MISLQDALYYWFEFYSSLFEQVETDGHWQVLVMSQASIIYSRAWCTND